MSIQFSLTPRLGKMTRKIFYRWIRRTFPTATAPLSLERHAAPAALGSLGSLQRLIIPRLKCGKKVVLVEREVL